MSERAQTIMPDEVVLIPAHPADYHSAAEATTAFRLGEVFRVASPGNLMGQLVSISNCKTRNSVWLRYCNQRRTIKVRV